MRAQYRLGVGISAIMDGMDQYIEFYNNLKATFLEKKTLIQFIVDYARWVEGHLTNLVQFQASTIFLECYCHFVVMIHIIWYVYLICIFFCFFMSPTACVNE